MKKLLIFDETFEAERIVKADSSIVGYIDDAVAFKFSGINDFSVFTIADGQGFDEPKLSEIEILKQQLQQIKDEKNALAETLDMILTDVLPALIP